MGSFHSTHIRRLQRLHSPLKAFLFGGTKAAQARFHGDCEHCERRYTVEV